MDYSAKRPKVRFIFPAAPCCFLRAIRLASLAILDPLWPILATTLANWVLSGAILGPFLNQFGADGHLPKECMGLQGE